MGQGHQCRRRFISLCIEEGLGLTATARRLGISPPGLFRWLKRHGPDLHKQLRDNWRPPAQVPTEEARRRLTLVKQAQDTKRSHVEVAGQLGITPAGLSLWLKYNCPDGIDQACEDYDCFQTIEGRAA